MQLKQKNTMPQIQVQCNIKMIDVSLFLPTSEICLDQVFSYVGQEIY